MIYSRTSKDVGTRWYLSGSLRYSSFVDLHNLLKCISCVQVIASSPGQSHSLPPSSKDPLHQQLLFLSWQMPHICDIFVSLVSLSDKGEGKAMKCTQLWRSQTRFIGNMKVNCIIHYKRGGGGSTCILIALIETITPTSTHRCRPKEWWKSYLDVF